MPAADREHGARRDVAKGAGSVFLAKTSSAIEIITQPAYTWMFGLATYGLYSVLWSLVNLVENVADLAMTAALQRLLPNEDEARARALIVRGAFILGVTPCLFLALSVSLASHLIAPLFNVAPDDLGQLELAIALFAWALPLWALLKIAVSALRACHAFGPEIRLRFLWEQIIRLLLAAAFWLAGMDTLALLLAHLLSLGITSLLALRLLNRHCSLKLAMQVKLSRDTTRELFFSGMSILPANILARMFVDMPAIILNFALPGSAGANAAGLYTIARKLSSIPQLVRSVFAHVVSPVASTTVNREHSAAQALYTFSIRISLLLALPTAFALIMAAEPILALFVTGATAAWPVVVILTAARGIEAALGPGPALQQVISHRGIPLLNSTIGFMIAALVLLAAFEPLQIIGVALAVACGQLAIVTLSTWQLSWIEKLSPFDGSVYRILGGAAIACLLILVAGTATSSLPVYINGVAVVIIYVCVLWLSMRFALPGGDRAALGKTGRRLKLSS